MITRSDFMRNGTNCSVDTDADDNLSEALPLPMKISLAVLLITVIFIGCIGNSILCLIVYKKPAMRSAINILLANMALSDILVSVVCMPFALLGMFCEKCIVHNMSCQIIAFLQEAFMSSAIFTLLAISVDRYRIIVRRKDKLTTSHAKMMTGITWFVSLVLALPPVVGWGNYKFYSGHSQCVVGIQSEGITELVYLILKITTTYFIPFIIMGFSYLYIVEKVRRDALRIRNCPDLDCAVSVTVTSGKLGLPIAHKVKSSHIDIHFKTRSFKTILILFITLAICWTPYGINLMSSNISGDYGCVRFTILMWLGYMKCAVNPFIYFIYISKFREACVDHIPTMFKFSIKLKFFSKRRINPRSIYIYQDSPIN